MKDKSRSKTDLKNVTKGDISNVGSMDIGDKIYNTIHQDKSIPKSLTTNIPLLSKDKIIGRDAYLDQLHQILHEKKDAVLVNGFGGVGKTTIAQVYAHTYWDEYAHVAWITFNSDDYVFEMVNAPGLKESLNITAEGADIQLLFSRMMVEINRISDKPNLLILDNAVGKLSQFKSFLPSSHEWHILITAREEINGFTSHYLDFLDEADAIALFTHHYKLKILTDDQISQLVRKVEYHTLTIEILAKTAQLQRLSFDTLKDALQQNIKSGVATSRSGEEKIENITGYLSSIFSLIELDGNEIWLLKNLLFLPTDYHSYELLNTIIDPTSSSKEEIFAETLTTLSKKSWILYNEETDSYKMHVVVTEVLKKKEAIHFEDISGLLNSLSDLLHLDQDKENPVDKFIWIPFGDHVLSVLDKVDEFTIDEENKLSNFLSHLGLIHKALGEYEEAKALLTKAMRSDEKNFGPEHPSTAIRYSNLALVLRDLGLYKEAKTLLYKAIVSDEKNFGTEHNSTAVSYSNLALVLRDLGDYEGAKKLFSKALASDKENFGPDHPNTARSYSNLASVLQDLGDYEGAKRLFSKAIVSAEKKIGIDHPFTASIYSNLALVLQDLGDYEGAKTLLSKALASDEKNFGPDHPTTAIRYSNLALVLQGLGDYEGAKCLFIKVIASNEKNFGPNHPTTSLGYSNLATLLIDLGNYEGAKTFMSKAIASDEKNFGHEHPFTARNYSNLAALLILLNEIPEAIILSKKALDIFKDKLPENHPNIKTVEEIYNHIKSLS